MRRPPGMGIVEIDIHGMTAAQARTAIDASLSRVTGSVYRIRVVHGSHRGNVLQTMVRKEYQKHKKVLRIVTTINPGETDLILREL